MQEAEQGPVYVQRVGTAETGAREQGEDVFERAQGARGPQRERCGQGSGDQQWHHVRVGQRQRAVVAGDGAQLAGPVGVGRVDLELGEHGLGDAVKQRCLVGRVAVKNHRVPIQGAGEAAHGQAVGPVAVDDLKRGGQHHLAGDLAVPAYVSILDGAVGWRLGHRKRTFSHAAGAL